MELDPTVLDFPLGYRRRGFVVEPLQEGQDFVPNYA